MVLSSYICMVTTCENHDIDKFVTLLKFPTDKIEQRRILRGVGMPETTKILHKTRICTQHFTDTSVQRVGKGYTLVPNPKIKGVDDINGEDNPLIGDNDGTLIEEEMLLYDDHIRNFESLVLNQASRLEEKLFEQWTVDTRTDSSLICFSQKELTADGLSIKKGVLINERKRVKVQIGKISKPVTFENGTRRELKYWSELVNVLNNASDAVNHDETLEDILKEHASKLEDIVSTIDMSTETRTKLRIMTDQMRNLLVKDQRRKRYCSDSVLTAFIVRNLSGSAYDALSNVWDLPTRCRLWQMSSALDTMNDKKYFKYLFDRLSPQERIVSIQIDEICLKQTVDYKNGKMKGIAENPEAEGEIAKSCQAVMISSAFGRMNEIIRLMPVTDQKGQSLADLILDSIKFVQDIGFEVVNVISDGLATNTKAFRILTDTQALPKGQCGEHFPNPHEKMEGKLIYVMYDTVHLFKNIRNSWYNNQSDGREFRFLNWDQFHDDPNSAEVECAKFETIRQFFQNHVGNITNDAFRVNFNCVNLGTWDKQNVKLVDALFDKTTIAAMRNAGHLAEARFLEIIRDWWDIVNVDNKFKGQRLLNPLMTPLLREDWKDGSCRKIKYLEKFLTWLENWNTHQDFQKHRLTNETYEALKHTVKAQISLTDYLFKTYDCFDYILLGKFQTDQLERRFGKYRTLAGNGYQKSMTEILESEKKMRLRAMYHNQPDVVDLVRKLERENKEKENIEDHLHEMNESYQFASIFHDQDEFDKVDLDGTESNQIHIAGYSAFKIGKILRKQGYKCECIKEIAESKGANVGDTYFDYLQRGGLTCPGKLSLTVCITMYKVLASIIMDDEYNLTFKSPSLNQKNELINHTLMFLESCELPFERECPTCKMELSFKMRLLASPIANTLLKANAQRINDEHLRHKQIANQMKVQKKRIKEANAAIVLLAQKNVTQADLNQMTPSQRRNTIQLSQHVTGDSDLPSTSQLQTQIKIEPIDMLPPSQPLSQQGSFRRIKKALKRKVPRTQISNTEPLELCMESLSQISLQPTSSNDTVKKRKLSTVTSDIPDTSTSSTSSQVERQSTSQTLSQPLSQTTSRSSRVVNIPARFKSPLKTQPRIKTNPIQAKLNKEKIFRPS